MPLVGYTAFTLLWIGRGVVLHPTTRVLGNADRDKTILMWSFRWWPHAIAHGQDPFVANVVWAPHGVDLAWVTSSPTLALVLSPLTAAFGPVFSYNFAALRGAAPRGVDDVSPRAPSDAETSPASLVAGFLFGFSPYVISQSITHLNLSFVCLVPLAGLLAVRFFEGSLGRWRYTALPRARPRAAVRHLDRDLRDAHPVRGRLFRTGGSPARLAPRLAALGRYTALAYLATGVVVTPYLYHAFVSGSAPPCDDSRTGTASTSRTSSSRRRRPG